MCTGILCLSIVISQVNTATQKAGHKAPQRRHSQCRTPSQHHPRSDTSHTKRTHCLDKKPAQWDEPVTQRTTLRHKIKGVMTKNSEYQSFSKFKFRFQIPIFKFRKHASDQHSKLLRRCQNSGVMGGLSPKEVFSDPPQRHLELYQ